MGGGGGGFGRGGGPGGFGMLPIDMLIRSFMSGFVLLVTDVLHPIVSKPLASSGQNSDRSFS
jgi:hypothetical protein